MAEHHRTFTAFEGLSRLAAGPLPAVRAAVLAAEQRGRSAPILIFDDETGDQIDVDLRPVDIPRSATSDSGRGQAEPRRAGRPKLGVVGREVTLLPRHWDWLAAQPGGASVALRKLVDAARKSNESNDLERKRRDAAHHFLRVLAGDLPGFEETSRALFAGDRRALMLMMASWPGDVRDHALRLLAPPGYPPP